MNGVAALEQRQHPATSTADWARAPLTSGLSSAGSLASQAETPTLKTSPNRNAPTLSMTPPFSKLARRIRRSTPAVLRRDSGVAIQQSSVASRARLQKSAGSMDPSHLDGRFTRVSISQALLLRPHPKEFLKDLTTGDESWVLYESNAHHVVWLPRGEDPPTQVSLLVEDLHQKKCLLCCFWDSQGMLAYEVLPQGHIVTGSIYASRLQKLASAVREKRLGWDTVPHLPYSLDLALSDYHLFRSLKAFLAKEIFSKFEEVERAVNDFFDSQLTSSRRKGLLTCPLCGTLL